MILDECHYLKSVDAKRSAAVYGRRGLVHHADRVWALSGTPSPNGNPAELWIMLHCYGLTRLSYEAFVARYCVMRRTPFGDVFVRGQNIAELRAVMAPVVLRRKKEQVMQDLPPILFGDVAIEPAIVPREKWEFYFYQKYAFFPAGRFEQDMAEADALMNTYFPRSVDVSMLAAIDRRQEIKSYRHWIGLQKALSVVELVKSELEANAYEKIVLFGVHKTALQELREGLAKYGAVLVYGGTPPSKREQYIDRFQNRKSCRVFIGQIQAAGTAINLTVAHQVMFVESDWVPANNQQAMMRCHRIGQTKPVTVRFANLAGSIDEKIQQALRRKTRTLTELFDPLEGLPVPTRTKFVNPFDE